MKHLTKAVLLFCTLGLAQVASAKDSITNSPVAMIGTSFGKSSTELIQFLKAIGVTPSITNGQENYQVQNGLMTITNGAACDNGHATFYFTADVMDNDGKVVKKIELGAENGNDGCTKPTKAGQFSDLMQKYGMAKMEPDCGAGHCRYNVNDITCYHDNQPKSDDLCNVTLSTVDLVNQ